MTSTGSQQSLKDIAAQERKLTVMKTELELQARLEKAKAMTSTGSQQSLKDIAAQERKLTVMKTELELQARLEKARARASSVSQQSLRNIAAQERLLIPLKMELDLQAKLAKARADAQFRTANKVDIASLQALNREQMVNLETTKAIDKLYRDHAKAAATLSKEYQEARAQLAPLTQAQQVHLQQIKLLDEWNTKLAKAMAMQSAPVQAAIKQYNDLTNKVERATKASKVFSESMSGTNQITAGFRAALAGVGMGFGIYTSGTILAASATYTVVAAFRDVIASGAEFEKEMARVNAAMNLTGEQYDDLSKRAIEMAASSRYSTNEIVKAYREMAMSGFTYQETVDGIGAVMAMASIGMMEFGEAADIATNVLFGFNLEAKDLSEVVDVLAKTVTNSAQDLRQLGNTMSYVAPVAASYGLSLEMVAAATEVLANAGIKGSRSGTGLRRTLTALFSDSENVAGVLGELGVSVNMLASDMDQEFLRVLKALNTATSGATTNVGKLSDAVGLYAIPTFLNLVKAADGSVDSLQALAEKYNDVGGAAYEMQQRMENALAVDWEKANAAISAIKTELFLMYGGDLRQFVQDMTAWIRALADSKDTLREVISLMKDLLVTVGQVTAAIIGLSMVKGAANFAGSAVAAYKGVKEAAVARVAAPAATGIIDTSTSFRDALAGRASGAVGGVVLAGAAATASTRDITAVTAATRGAAEATTMWAAAKKVLGVAFRAVPYIGTALILKDMYDIYQGLNVVVPKQADEVNQLADAQRRLNETFKGFRFSKANEGYTIDVAKTKRSLDELGASLEATQNKILDVEGQIDRALQAGVQDPARLRLLAEELGKLRKQYVALLQEAEAGETKLSRTAHNLIAKEREALTQQAINLERLRDQAQQAYDRALAEMS